MAPAIDVILPALERFVRFDMPEQASKRRTEWSAQLEEPLPATGVGMQAVLELLRDVVIPSGSPIGAPGFSGWINTIPTPVPIAAALAANVASPQRMFAHAFNTLEALALHWLAELLGLPSTYQGVFTSGGSVANLVGLGAARQYAAEQLGLDPAHDGLAAFQAPRIYASTEVHHVVHRAAGVLGLGRKAVVAIPTDDALRIDVAALRERLYQDRTDGCTPVAVVANAGTVNTGAVDPIPELAALCHEQGLWLHVDGAYGLLGILDPEVAPLYGDLAAADSLVLDPHKWLAAPIGCGTVFVRDGALLGRAFTQEPAAYLEGSQLGDPDTAPLASQFAHYGYPFHEFAVEHSAPARGVQVWSILKEIGAEGVRARICRDNAYARHLARRVQTSPTLELLAPVTLSICCFRYVPQSLRGRSDDEVTKTLNTLNRMILERVQARGRCVPSGTTVHGAFAIRPCYINPRTTLADVDALVDEVGLCGAEVWEALSTSMKV